VKERRKRKEKERKPSSQLPGWSEDRMAPGARVRGRIQRRSIFLRFM
jgi:hypothetical protein